MDESSPPPALTYFPPNGAACTHAESATFLSAPSSLDAPESKSHVPFVEHLAPDTYSINSVYIPSASPLESTFRHSGWEKRRRQVFDAMVAMNFSPRQVESFCECGASLWLQKSVGGDDIRLVSNGCRNRFCIPCANERAARLTTNLQEKMEITTCRFLTLTMRHSPTKLNDQIDRIYRDFSALRRRAWWKAAVHGGAAFLECKLSEQSGYWHVHLHIICQGTFIEQKKLSEEWHAVTGDSYIVDVRSIQEASKAAYYVTKYVTKPADSSVFAQPSKLQEMMLAMRGRHLCYTFGVWRKLQLMKSVKGAGEWVAMGSIDGLREKAAAGDKRAESLLYAAERKYPLLSRIQRPPPPDVDPFQ